VNMVIKFRWMKWAENVQRMEDLRNFCNVLVVESEGRCPLARPTSSFTWKRDI
jgi:hypothetical protein